MELVKRWQRADRSGRRRRWAALRWHHDHARHRHSDRRCCGFAAGLTADLMGNHGASKARRYNTLTVVPTLQQLMNGYRHPAAITSRASMGINDLRIQSQKQTAQWGSGATSYYHSVMVPEIQAMRSSRWIAKAAAGRANVTTTAAQFHGGGWIDDFLDMATSDSEGFIHARQGEYMMHNAAASTNAPWLEAMNRGLELTSALAPVLSPGATPRETGAASNLPERWRQRIAAGGAASRDLRHLHVHALRPAHVSRWLRSGGAMQIQTELNRNTGALFREGTEFVAPYGNRQSSIRV